MRADVLKEETMRLKVPRPFAAFALYFVFLVLLPSGSIFGVNLKILAFLPVCYLATRGTLRQKDGLFELALSGGLIAVFLVWIAVAQFYSFYNIGLSLFQFRDIVTTFAGCWFVRLFTANLEDRKSFVRLCLYATAFGGLLKLLIFVYSLRSGVSISTIMDAISRVFGVQLMVFELGDAGGRIQFPSDTLIPVCLFAILCLRKRLTIGKVASFVIVTLLLASSLFTFSRFLWFYTAVGALLGFVIGRRDKMHLLYLGLTGAAVAYSFDLLVTVIQLRFSSQVIDNSDSDRSLQKGALLSFFRDAPLFGHGLGSYTNQVIRSADLPYNYEMQLVALAGQVGTFGLLLLIAILINYYRRAFSLGQGSRTYQGAVFVMLLCFLSAGFVNPYLVSSIAAATFGLLFALASLHSASDAERGAFTSIVRAK